MKEHDKQLIKKAQEGDTRAFEHLIKVHESKIYNLLLGMTGNKASAEDLFQETFLAAWRKIKTFKGKSDFSTWLYRIAFNNVLMKRRIKKKINTVSIDEPIIIHGKETNREFPEDWSKSPAATFENDELKNRISKSIKAMPEKYRKVLILRDVEEMNNEEVTKILNISLASVKSRLHRARLYLRNTLSRYFKGQ
jgi:RNA polymerase sigma-70 factor, ECF subfamily